MYCHRSIFNNFSLCIPLKLTQACIETVVASYFVCSKGSVVVALETKLSKTVGTDEAVDVVKRVKDVLTTAVKSGSLPSPTGGDSLKTVKTALPQVATIPDGATGKCAIFLRGRYN